MLQVDFDFASWTAVLLRYTFWTSTLTCLVYIMMEKAIIKLQNNNSVFS